MISSLLIVLVLAAAAGFIVCFRGQKMLALAFGIMAFTCTYQFLTALWGTSPAGLVAAVAVAVVAILLVRFAQSLAFFLIGFVSGIMIGNVVMGFVPIAEAYIEWIVIISFGLILGFLGKHYQKGIIRILTGICGGTFLAGFTLLLMVHIGNLSVFDAGNVLDTATGMITFMSSALSGTYSLYGLVLTVIYSVCGILYQNKHH